MCNVPALSGVKNSMIDLRAAGPVLIRGCRRVRIAQNGDWATAGSVTFGSIPG
jgi:hypothetical protein